MFIDKLFESKLIFWWEIDVLLIAEHWRAKW